MISTYHQEIVIIYVCIDLNCYPEPKKYDNFEYNVTAANIHLIKQALSNVKSKLLLVMWTGYTGISWKLNTNESWLLFKSIFQGFIDKYVEQIEKEACIPI